ncbi:MAG: DoxX family protein [Flavobacteriales bacterium]|jgi:hypothetical protein|nr:DoxX family protein [Flavobacteriales bacterium]
MNERTLSFGDVRTARTVWAAQIVLCIAFGVLGTMRLLLPMATLTDLFIWPGQLPVWMVRAIGAVELLGALGLVLPAITGIAPWLMRWAAFGLAAMLVFALGYHIMLFKGAMLLPSLVLLVMAVYVGVRRM